MNAFNYFQPTRIMFGRGRLNELPKVITENGTRCLLVTTPSVPELAPLYDRVKSLLAAQNIPTAHFDGVIPNPTTEVITAGAKIARQHQADVIIGLGGGSSMDTAKAIAVEATHPGSAWDYIWCSKTQPTAKTLPVIAVSTTSGTGSQVTQVAVLTRTADKCKSALYNSIIYPRVAIVDPELMVSVPPKVTACTGWDVFTHAFESAIHSGTSSYVTLLAFEAIRLVKENLPRAVKNGSDVSAREAMAYADTLAGLCIANAGVTLPHGMGMAIGGMYPQVAHGQALAVTYPCFTRFTYASAVESFARMGRILNPELTKVSDAAAAEGSCAAVDSFLKEIGMWLSLEGLGVPKAELGVLADACMVLPDYKANPRVATLADIRQILEESYRR